MAYLIQHRRDTIENWEKYNPILADGEMGFIKDVDGEGNQKSSLYKIGDGRHLWKDLPLFGYNGNVHPDFEGDDLEHSVPTRALLKNELDGKLNTDQLKQDIKLTELEEAELEEGHVVDTEHHIVSRAALISGFDELEGSINDLNIELTELDTELNTKLTELDTELDTQAGSIESINATITTHTNNLTDHQERISDCEDYLVKGYSEDVNGVPTQQRGLVSRVTALEGFPKSTVMSSEQFNSIPVTSLQENTLYFIYDETTQE